MKKLIIGILAIAIALFSFLLYKNSLPKYTITRVIDGDTFVIQGISSPKGTVRLIGVDTPEVGECYFQQAKDFVASFIGLPVKVEYDVNKMDQFGRALVYVSIPAKDNKWILLNTMMLEQGIGRYYTDQINLKYGVQFLASANEGYKNKFGLWTQCTENKTIGCTIKGNVGRDGKRYYHLPSFRHYAQTVVNFDKGDMYFCSEQEAISKGWARAVE